MHLQLVNCLGGLCLFIVSRNSISQLAMTEIIWHKTKPNKTKSPFVVTRVDLDITRLCHANQILPYFTWTTFIMPPTSKKLIGHIRFGLCVHPSIRSRTVHARVLKFHIWIPHGKIFDTCFIFLSEFSPFLELCPFEKIRMKSDACHILWTVHARVLKFHIWICQQDISNIIWARGLKLSQMIGNDE